MKARVVKTIDKFGNDKIYNVDDIIEVFEMKEFDNYAVYYEHTLDWIPKDCVEIINQ